MRSLRSHSLPNPRPEQVSLDAGEFVARSYRVPATPSRLRSVRQHVDQAAADFGFGADDRYRWVVAVNEAATNAIKHGRPYQDGTILVHIDVCDDTMVCSISDRGEFVTAPPDDDALAERGRGFQLMELFADETEVSTGAEGTTVRLHKRRPDTTPDPA
jgi:serine/threonine-protein kinase RsbW